MASLHFLFLSLLFVSLALAWASTPTKVLIISVKKDPSTLQYITQIKQRTPLVSVGLTLDLGGQNLWVDCENYVSSTYRPARCRSAQCSLARSTACGNCTDGPEPGCNVNTCAIIIDNTITRTATMNEVASDVFSIQSTNGKNPGKYVLDPHFLFACGSKALLEGLASGAKGMAGLGRTKISLPSQLSADFSFHRKFAICLTSNSNGVVFFGDGPYVFLPGIDVSTSLRYTPLILNKVSTASAYTQGDPSSDYFIHVKSIKINQKKVPINSTLLLIDREGYGGTKISTVNPYTVLETSIYRELTGIFSNELRGVPRVAPVAPFSLCFDSRAVGSTRLGPAVPSIDLELDRKSVVWSIFGANSLVQVSESALCLGFVDGGVRPRTSIVIGGHQIEDNLLQFDLPSSRLGFSSTLLGRQTNCANFNFTSNL